MKRLASFLVFLLLLPLAKADTVFLNLYIGDTVDVNGVSVHLVDISNDYSAMLSVNGQNYLLVFGGNVSIPDRNLTIYLGSVYPEKRLVHLILEGPELKLKKARGSVELRTTFPSRVTPPGGSVSFTITVKNLGEDGFYPLRLKLPMGWEGKLLAEGSEIAGVYLGRGESASFNVVVRAGKVPGDYPVVVMTGESSLRLTVHVERVEVSLSADYPEKEVEAGRSVNFRIHLSSTGEVTLPLSARVPEGWSARFIAGSDVVRMIHLKERAELLLSVSVPSDAPVGRYAINVSAGEAHETLYAYVNRTHAGENGTLSLRVFDEESGSFLPGVTVALYRGGKPVAEAKTLSDGSAVLQAPEGDYTLRVSKEAYREVERRVHLSAGSKTEETIGLTRLPYYFVLQVQAPSKSATLGETITYEFTLRNLGLNDDEYHLSIVPPEGWGAIVTENPESRQGITSTYLKSGEEKRLYAVLIPPDSVKLGNYTATLRVESSGSGEIRTSRLTVSLTGSYGITLVPERYSLEVNAGKEKALRVRVKNTGTSPLTNVELKVNAPEGWTVKVSPGKVASLGGGDWATFTVRVTPPANADAGDYVINVEAVSDQKKASDRIRITVERAGTGKYAGIGIILGSLILLAIILRKYGRR